jgi:hypothetical protein
MELGHQPGGQLAVVERLEQPHHGSRHLVELDLGLVGLEPAQRLEEPADVRGLELVFQEILIERVAAATPRREPASGLAPRGQPRWCDGAVA